MTHEMRRRLDRTPVGLGIDTNWGGNSHAEEKPSR